MPQGIKKGTPYWIDAAGHAHKGTAADAARDRETAQLLRESHRARIRRRPKASMAAAERAAERQPGAMHYGGKRKPRSGAGIGMTAGRRPDYVSNVERILGSKPRKRKPPAAKVGTAPNAVRKVVARVAGGVKTKKLRKSRRKGAVTVKLFQ